MLSSLFLVARFLFANPEGVASVLAILEKYGPLVKSVVQYIEAFEEEKAKEEAASAITQGFQYATQTGDTSLLEKAIHDHCGRNGCRLP